MCSAFIKSGFKDVIDQIDIKTGDGLAAGDVLWISGHTCIYVGDGKVANARLNENDKTSGGVTGDQNSKENAVNDYYNKKWTKVLRYTN